MTNLLRIMFLALGLVLPLCSQVAGQSGEGQGASYDLVIQNRKVFSFRAGLGSLSAHERLVLVQERLANMPVEDLQAPVNYILAPEAAIIKVGDRPLFSIAHGDLDADIGQTLEEAVFMVRPRLEDALIAEASQRNVSYLLSGFGRSLAAIAIFLIVAVLLRRIAKFAMRKTTRLAISGLPDYSSAIGPYRLAAWMGTLVRVTYYASLAMATYLGITYVLECFPYTQPWGDTLGAGLLRLILSMGKSVLHGIPGIFAIAVIAFVARGLTRLINNYFKSMERGDTAVSWIHPDTAAPTRRIVVALLWVFAVVMAYPHIPGNESIAFKSISVFIGLLVSFGSAGVVNQAMNGLAIMYARSFKTGDYVKIGEVEGTVSELSMLSTKLHTIRHEEIVIPNSVVISQTTHNYTRLLDEHGVGISTTLRFNHDVPWRQVHALLLMAAKNTNGLTKDPAPYVIQTDLGSACEYTLVVHMVADPKLRQFVKSELHQNIQDSFNQFGLKLMTPLYIESGMPGAVPPEKWYADPAKRE
ncbi:MAG: mechanosensitive ion channel family protein [Holophagaceae bacterium]|nr:mechanosensitive ion channel family protein [Holophagaceae bacterium]